MHVNVCVGESVCLLTELMFCLKKIVVIIDALGVGQIFIFSHTKNSTKELLVMFLHCFYAKEERRNIQLRIRQKKIFRKRKLAVLN